MMTFTVVTITYNAEAGLQRTLDSVLEQTYLRIEHLIIDGCSKDRTLAMAEVYKQKADSLQEKTDGLREIKEGRSLNVIISSEPDKGLYDAMNKGLSRATGDYIVFMNAGDSFASAETLANVAKAIEKAREEGKESGKNTGKDVAVAYGETLWTDNDGNIIGKRNHAAPKRLSWRSFKKGMLVCHQAFYARTDIARKYPYDLRYRHSADIDWCINIMKEAERQDLQLVNVGEVVALYQREGQTTENHRASLRERFDVMSRHYGWLTTAVMHIWFVIRQLVRKVC